MSTDHGGADMLTNILFGSWSAPETNKTHSWRCGVKLEETTPRQIKGLTHTEQIMDMFKGNKSGFTVMDIVGVTEFSYDVVSNVIAVAYKRGMLKREKRFNPERLRTSFVYWSAR